MAAAVILGNDCMAALARMRAHSDSFHFSEPFFQPRALLFSMDDTSPLRTDGLSWCQGLKNFERQRAACADCELMSIMRRCGLEPR